MEKKCKICQVIKPVETGFLQSSSYITDDGGKKFYYRGECIECCNNNRRGKNNDYSREYNARPEIKERRKKYRQEIKKKDNYLEKQRIYENKRYTEDPVYRLKKCIGVRIRRAIKSKRWNKTNKTQEYLGCTYEQLRLHLESQFTSEMNWDNHGIYWDIDHIECIGQSMTPEEIHKFSHYTNLRPLPKEEHRIKSSEDNRKIILRKANNNQ
jgi:hypothetical protein